MTTEVLTFEKWQGTGNDFVVVDGRQQSLPWSEVARRVSDRRRGVGADGLLVAEAGRDHLLAMRYFNADGQEAEMCGNGLRCLALFAARHGVSQNPLNWETGAGVVTTRRRGDVVEVEMGSPRVRPADIPVAWDGKDVLGRLIEVEGQQFEVSCVGFGNPHAIVFVNDVDDSPVETLGPRFEDHPMFPHGVNTTFVEVVSKRDIRQRTYERGVGETEACGTAACAAAHVSSALGLTEATVTVHTRGGDLEVSRRTDGSMTMAGPATRVFEGTMTIKLERSQ